LIKRNLQLVREYLSNPYLWVGIGGLSILVAIVYFVFNSIMMPNYTRHDVSTEVPDVMNLSAEVADSVLASAGLRTELVVLRKPNLPLDVVIDQTPPPRAQVKPGRHIYLTVNTGDTTTVLVPRVETYGVRQARNMISQSDLVVGSVLPDSIPSVYEDIVTHQEPAAGERVPPGTVVNLLFGTGLGDEFVTVPDVTGLPVDEARAALLGLRLRSIVIGETAELDDLPIVLEQGPEAGASVKEGYEIRLRLTRTNDE